LCFHHTYHHTYHQYETEGYILPILFFRKNGLSTDDFRASLIGQYKKWQQKEFLPLWQNAKSNPYYSFDHTIHHVDCDDKKMIHHVPHIGISLDLCCSSCRATVDIEWYPFSTWQNELLWSIWELKEGKEEEEDNDKMMMKEKYKSYIQWLPEELLKEIIDLYNLYYVESFEC
jgi:hypothetical protein